MSLFIASLNSGSNGNCYYVGNDSEAVLVDVGISCKEIEKRMLRCGLFIKKVKAIFISHEHSDHIRGVEVTAKRYGIPVYITASTLKSGRLRLATSLVKPFKAYEPVIVGDLSVTAFPKLHDAAEPHSFTVEGEGIITGIFTDIGLPCDDVIKNFSQCHAAFLESNYDEKMLEEGSYPYHLKKRIRSEKGHLSNDQALELFRKHKPSYMSHLLLSHLSKDNNKPELVHQLFAKHAGNTHIAVASRYQETEVYHVRRGYKADEKKPDFATAGKQISLF